MRAVFLRLRPRVLLYAAHALLAGCDALEAPENLEDVEAGSAYQAFYRAPPKPNEAGKTMTSSEYEHSLRCSGPDPVTRGHHPMRDHDVLSPGDLLEVFVEDDETFSGRYVVSRDGRLRIPFAPPMTAAGRQPEAVAANIETVLLSLGFYDVPPRVSVIISDFAEARVTVAGAVFEPGQYVVGGSNAQTRDLVRQEAIGASTFSRSLSSALRSAGGIRPDADLQRVVIHRGSQHILVNARPGIDGRAFNDLLLIAGGRIEVPSRKCFQEDLMVPGPLTPPGVRVFMSNLTAPADSNAESAIGREARDLRYGTRFIQAAVGMNCIGGAKLSNANRRVVLFSRNPVTGQSVVIERRIEDLLRRSDRDQYDPYILPNDALACYDSNVISFASLAAALGVVGAAIYLAP